MSQTCRRVASHKLPWLFAFAALALSNATCFADSFDWRNADGQNDGQCFVSPVKAQVSGTCWAYSAVGALEAKYMLTRNDPAYAPDCSEWNLVCPENGAGGGTIDGGGPGGALNYIYTTGIVSEAELPPSGYNGSPLWPLQPGSENRVWKTATYPIQISQTDTLSTNVAVVKQALKLYGPLSMTLANANHAVVLTGYQDDPSSPGGGCWIYKNSWGTGWSDNGYGTIDYATQSSDPYWWNFAAIPGAAYYTGTMAIATWQGVTNVWSAGDSANWNSGGSAYTWANQETAAVFNTLQTAPIVIGGTVIAHGLTFNAGATGYTFSGGSLTVTGGGITANESVTVNTAVTIGAPQTWTVAAGKTLTIGAPVHTVVSTLTIAGAGNTYIAGDLDGGGIINSLGAAPGGLVMSGSGTLTLAGANCVGPISIGSGTTNLLTTAADNVTGPITITGGSLNVLTSIVTASYACPITVSGGTLNLAPSLGSVATFSGNINFTSGSLVKSDAGTAVLTGANAYGGVTSILSGVLELAPPTGTISRFKGKITGPGAIVVDGPGTVLLYVANDYTGLTTVTGGVLEFKVNAVNSFVGSSAGGADIMGGIVLFDYPNYNYNYALDLVATIRADILSGLIYTTAAGKYLAVGDNGLNRVTVSLLNLIQGDADGNGTVNGADLNTVLTNYNQTVPSGRTGWMDGDFDGNGMVNGADLNTVLSNYNQSLGWVTNAVPEPSTLLLAVVGLVGLLVHAWRKGRQ